MGWKHQVTLAIVLPVNLLAVAFCSWVLCFTYQSAIATCRKKGRAKVRQTSNNSDVLCPCLFKGLSTVQFTMAVAIACVTCFALACVARSVSWTILVVKCFDVWCWPKSLYYFTATNVVFSTAGFLLLFVSHFERLRLTFAKTTRRLPKWAPAVMYACVIVAAFLRAVMYVFYKSTFYRGLCAVTLILMYFVSVFVLVVAFFNKTMAVGKDVGEHGAELANAAVRVTVCATVSLLSSTVVFLLMALLWIYSMNSLFWATSLLTADMCFNAFCLMCTFRRAEGHYRRVFGKLHDFALRRAFIFLTPTRDSLTTDLVVSKTSDSLLN